MSANTKAEAFGTPTKAQLKQLVRNDETFIGLYTAILASLHARRKPPCEPFLYDEYDFHETCANLAKLAYIAACHGYAQLKLAEPDESEIEAFNQAVEENSNNHNHPN